MKYAPKTLDEVIIQDKKVQEFISIVSNDKARLLLLSGPPGCGKNTLIDLYCKQNNIQVVRYKDEQDSKYVYDSLEIAKDPLLRNQQAYPNDLENLIHYLRINAKAQSASAVSGQGLKTSSFSAAAKKKPSLEESKLSQRSSGKDSQRRVIVINGFLLCLKIFNPRRFEFIKDFNDALRTIVFSNGPTPLIIFTLSDSQERVPSFVNKIL